MKDPNLSDTLFLRTSLNGQTPTYGAYEFKRPRVRRSIRVRPEIWDLFQGLAKEKGTRDCELFEAWTLAAASTRDCIPEPGSQGGPIYVFTEMILERVTRKRHEIYVERSQPGDLKNMVHGSPERCHACDQASFYEVHNWTGPLMVHTIYCCKVHGQDLLSNLKRTGARHGWQPLTPETPKFRQRPPAPNLL